MVKVRDRFGGKVRFKGGLKCRVNSVIIDATTEITVPNC